MLFPSENIVPASIKTNHICNTIEAPFLKETTEKTTEKTYEKRPIGEDH
jgi:hypothetical protein